MFLNKARGSKQRRVLGLSPTRALHLTIAGFCTALLASMVFSIHLSTLEVSFGTMVVGSPHFWRGQTAALHVMPVEPRQASVLPLVSGSVRLRSVGGASVGTSDGPGRDAGVYGTFPLAPEGHVVFVVPPDLPDQAEVVVQVVTDMGGDQLNVPVRGVDLPPKALAQWLEPDPGPPKGAQGSWQGGMDDKARGGLRELPEWQRRRLAAKVELSPGDFSFGPSVQRLVQAVTTLPVRRPLQVDLWAGQALIWTGGVPVMRTAQGDWRGELSLPLPTDPQWRGWLTTHTTVNRFMPEAQRAAVYRYRTALGDEVPTAATSPAGARPGPKAQLHVQVPAENVLANSLPTRRAAVAERREELRGLSHQLFLGTGLAGLALLALGAFRHQRRLRRRVRSVLTGMESESRGQHTGVSQAAGSSDASQSPDDPALPVGGLRQLAELSGALMAVGMALYCVYVLLEQMRWE